MVAAEIMQCRFDEIWGEPFTAIACTTKKAGATPQHSGARKINRNPIEVAYGDEALVIILSI